MRCQSCGTENRDDRRFCRECGVALLVVCSACGTANDAGDGDSGPNNLQNFPAIGQALAAPASTTIAGTLNSTPNSTYTIEFFSSPAADPSGYGEGQTYLGSTAVAIRPLSVDGLRRTLCTRG